MKKKIVTITLLLLFISMLHPVTFANLQQIRVPNTSLQLCSIQTFESSNPSISEFEPGDIAFKHPDIFPDYLPTIIDHCLSVWNIIILLKNIFSLNLVYQAVK